MEEEQLEIAGPLEEPLMENIVPEEINDLDSLSSSDTDDSEKPDSPVPINAPIYRMFGRERPIHMVLGGGKRTKHSLHSFDFISHRFGSGNFGLTMANLVFFFLGRMCLIIKSLDYDSIRFHVKFVIILDRFRD